MKSKEALDKLRKHDAFIPLGEELDLFDILKKDLEELEELKKLMTTPIQDIMKRLKILDILKYHIGYNYELNCLISNLEYRNEAEENNVREWLSDGKD